MSRWMGWNMEKQKWYVVRDTLVTSVSVEVSRIEIVCIVDRNTWRG